MQLLISLKSSRIKLQSRKGISIQGILFLCKIYSRFITQYKHGVLVRSRGVGSWLLWRKLKMLLKNNPTLSPIYQQPKIIFGVTSVLVQLVRLWYYVDIRCELKFKSTACLSQITVIKPRIRSSAEQKLTFHRQLINCQLTEVVNLIEQQSDHLTYKVVN